MINLILIAVVCVIAYIHPMTRLALIYSLPIVFFAGIYEYLDDNSYYLVAGFTSFCTVLLMKRFTERSELRRNLIWLCFASIFINFFGLGIYHAGMEPTAYNALLSLMYVAAIIILMRSCGRGNIKNNSIRTGIRGHAYQNIRHSDQ